MGAVEFNLSLIRDKASKVFGSRRRGQAWMERFNLALASTPTQKVEDGDMESVLKVLEAIERGFSV
jgi:hypothetical protein